MAHNYIIENLAANRLTFESILKERRQDEYLYKQDSTKWCLLEVVCHLRDEEVEDFRTRVRHVMEHPNTNPPPIDPVAWVKDRNYLDQDYNDMLKKFLYEREKSIQWLNSLENPAWKNSFKHSSLGTLTSEHFLFNWLGHDYLHLRQITRLLFNYTQEKTKNDLRYAGDW
ncbi:MAG: DinB family protein [Bacteroidia bacterium]|nr:DinB family protein [Bacteroidia bacterium]NNC85513.1 hypothetical protein [Bacteroidia bacterium]